MTKTTTKNDKTLSSSVLGATALILSIVFLTPKTSDAIVRVKVAPEVGRHVFQLDAGGTGSFEDFAGDQGFSWSAGWTYHADNVLGLGVTVGNNAPESDVFTSVGTLLDFQYTYVTATVHVRAPTRSAFIPHLQAGFGYYNLNIDEFDRLTRVQLLSIDDNKFGMFFGFGLDYLIAPHLSIGAIANYHFVSLDQNIPQTQGLGEWYNTWDIKAVLSIYTR